MTKRGATQRLGEPGTGEPGTGEPGPEHRRSGRLLARWNTVPPEWLALRRKSRAEFAAERAARRSSVTTQWIEVEPPPRSRQEPSRGKRVLFAVVLLATLAGVLAVTTLWRPTELAPEPAARPPPLAAAEPPRGSPVAAPSAPSAVATAAPSTRAASAKPLTPRRPVTILPSPSAPADPEPSTPPIFRVDDE